MSGLVERTEERDRVADLLEAAGRGHGGVLTLQGPAGIGKTAILTQAAAEAGRRGLVVGLATGHPIESALSFGLLRQLLEPLLERVASESRVALTAGPGRAAVALLDGGPRTGGDELELVHAAYRLVRDLIATTGRPVLLVVDDLQWGDRSSVTFLLYLSQRLADLPVALLLTVRTGEDGDVGDLLARLLAQAGPGATTLAPISAAGCAELARRRFPGATDAFCREGARVTGGNPLLLTELFDAVAAAGAGPDDATAQRLHQLSSVSLRRSTNLRLSGCGPAGLAVAEAAAILEQGAPLRRVVALTGLDAGEVASTADALVRVGVLTSNDPPAFAHPLIRSTVREGIPEAERGLRHRRAAELALQDGASAEQVAAHLIRASPAGDPATVGILRDAARDARGRGAALSACRYLERALVEPPDPGERARILAELAEAELLTGRRRAVERLDEALRAATDAETELAVLMRIGDVLFQSGQYAEAAAVFDRAVHLETGADAELTSRLRACRLAMETLRPGGRVDADLVDVPDEQPAAGTRFLQVHLALASVMGVSDHGQTRRLALGALGNGAMLRERGIGLDLLVALGCLVWCDLFDECDQEVARALELADGQAAHLARAHLLFGRAWMRYWSGRLEDAVADSLEAIEPWRGGWNGQIHFARFWCASALVELDRLDEARAVLDQSDSAEPGVDDVGVATTQVARGRLAAAEGDLRGARGHLEAAAGLAATLPFLANPTVLPWRSELALVLHATGAREEAGRLVDEELRLARAYGAGRPLGVALRAHGLVAGGMDSVAALQRSVEVLSDSPARLEEARARIDLGSALLREGRTTDGGAALRRGLELAVRLGAVRLEARARAELAGTADA